MQSCRGKEAGDILPGEEAVAQVEVLGGVGGDDVELFGDDACFGVVATVDLCVSRVAAEAVGRFEGVEGRLLLRELEGEAAAFFQRVEDGGKEVAVVII